MYLSKPLSITQHTKGKEHEMSCSTLHYRARNSRGENYLLFARRVELRNHIVRDIYFFTKEENAHKNLANPKHRPLITLPRGYGVVENKITGLLTLKRVNR